MSEHQQEVVEIDAATARFLRLNRGPDKYSERILNLVEGCQLLDAIPLLVGADFGSWSRVDVDRILERMGWPVEEDRYGVKAVIETDSQWSYVSAAVTPDHMDPERWGFGEFYELSMTQYVTPAQLDRAYASALEACVRLLGAPPLIGGPDAFAMWCGPDITIRLTRSIRYSNLHLGIEPTQPSAGREHWEWKWNEEWQSRDSWQVRPDRTRNGGMPEWGHPEPPATTWDGLDGRLRELFSSLGADMPTLREYVTNIVWTIDSRSSKGFVQGVFSTDAGTCYIEMWDNGEELFSQTYPLTIEGSEDAATATLARLREIATTPEELRLSQAWTDEGYTDEGYTDEGRQRPSSRVLWKIRFGLSPDNS
ncbi:DUF6301 family protein [Nocardia sp. R16R-3T]